jgi:hypothetical protein
MNQQIEQIKDVAMGVVHGILASAHKPDVSFKRVFELLPGEGRELLVVGSVRRDRCDGYCIAVLNPGLTLQELLQPESIYSPATLKNLVAGHCDAMVQVQVVNKHPSVASCYHAYRR